MKTAEEDLAFLIKFCINEQQEFANLRNQNIILNIPEKLITSFDKEQIYEVVSNLISNAIKYTSPGGEIKIQTETENGYLIISVEDNGVGFTKEENERIFQQFGKVERYGQGMDLVSDGTGLGLYISKKIIELHGGKIWLESEGRNKGSKFCFTLPLIKS